MHLNIEDRTGILKTVQGNGMERRKYERKCVREITASSKI